MGAAAARVAGVEEIGGVIRVVEQAIFGVIEKLIKPAAKLYDPLADAMEGVQLAAAEDADQAARRGQK